MDRLHRESVAAARREAEQAAAAASAVPTLQSGYHTKDGAKKIKENAFRPKRIKVKLKRRDKRKNELRPEAWAKTGEMLSAVSPFAPSAQGRVILSQGGFLKGFLVNELAVAKGMNTSDGAVEHLDVCLPVSIPNDALEKSVKHNSLIAVSVQRDTGDKHSLEWPRLANFALLGWYVASKTWKEKTSETSKTGTVSNKTVRKVRLQPAQKAEDGPEAELDLPDLIHYADATESGQYYIDSQCSAALLDTAVRCPSCHFALPRLQWTGWTCLPCELTVLAPDIDESAFDLSTRWTIEYSGPRLDAGWAVFDESLSRRIFIWHDNIKTATYNDGASVVLHHILASSHLQAESSQVTPSLFARSMTYQRPDHSSTFVARFGIDTCTVTGEVLHNSTTVYRLKASVELQAVAESTDEVVSRFVESPQNIKAFDAVDIFVKTQGKVMLSELIGKAACTKDRLAIRHFGAPAQLVLRRFEQQISNDKKGAQATSAKCDVATLAVSPGDIIYLPQFASFAGRYEIELVIKSLSATCVFHCIESADSQ